MSSACMHEYFLSRLFLWLKIFLTFNEMNLKILHTNEFIINLNGFLNEMYRSIVRYHEEAKNKNEMSRNE